MALTDAQVLAIIHATRLLQTSERTAFLTALKARLANRNEIGDGELHRTLAELQRKYFRPPTDTETGMLETQRRRTARA